MINRKKAQWYCKDDISLIENYDKAINDKSQIWDCHHRRETIFSKSDLIEIGEYYKRPAIELIFLTQKEHLILHHKGKKFSEETKNKMSDSHKGKKFSEETKNKMSDSHKGIKHSKKAKRKIAEYRKGKKLSEETRKKISESLKGIKNHLGHKHSEETKQKMTEARKLYWEKQRQLKTNNVVGTEL